MFIACLFSYPIQIPELPNVTSFTRTRVQAKLPAFYGFVIRLDQVVIAQSTNHKSQDRILPLKISIAASLASAKEEEVSIIISAKIIILLSSRVESLKRKSGQLRPSSRLNLIIFSRLFDHSPGCYSAAATDAWKVKSKPSQRIFRRKYPLRKKNISPYLAINFPWQWGHLHSQIIISSQIFQGKSP